MYMVLYALSVRMGFQNWELHPRRFAHTDAFMPGEFSNFKMVEISCHLFLYVDLYSCMSIDVNINLEIDIDIDTDYIGMCT